MHNVSVLGGKYKKESILSEELLRRETVAKLTSLEGASTSAYIASDFEMHYLTTRYKVFSASAYLKSLRLQWQLSLSLTSSPSLIVKKYVPSES
jgi:hypothetical protein